MPMPEIQKAMNDLRQRRIDEAARVRARISVIRPMPSEVATAMVDAADAYLLSELDSAEMHEAVAEAIGDLIGVGAENEASVALAVVKQRLFGHPINTEGAKK